MYKMYLVYARDIKMKVVCESCAVRGAVASNCTKCNGEGTHHKATKWYVSKPIDIEKIDRGSEDISVRDAVTGELIVQPAGSLRYWVDASYYYAEQEKLIHFTKQDAAAECHKRNHKLHGPLLAMHLEKTLS